MIRDLLKDANDDPISAAVIALVVSALIGGAFGYWSMRDVVRDWNTKAELRAACIGGNDRACRVYEVDHGRGGWL